MDTLKMVRDLRRVANRRGYSLRKKRGSDSYTLASLPQTWKYEDAEPIAPPFVLSDLSLDGVSHALRIEHRNHGIIAERRFVEDNALDRAASDAQELAGQASRWLCVKMVFDRIIGSAAANGGAMLADEATARFAAAYNVWNEIVDRYNQVLNSKRPPNPFTAEDRDVFNRGLKAEDELHRAAMDLAPEDFIDAVYPEAEAAVLRFFWGEMREVWARMESQGDSLLDIEAGLNLVLTRARDQAYKIAGTAAADAATRFAGTAQ